MKKLLLGAAACVVFAAPAFAADLPARTYTKAPVYKAPEAIYNWTGFYIGGHIGAAFPGSSSLDTSNVRFMGGLQGGFDYQFANNWVIGAEAQYSWLSGNVGAVFPGGLVYTNNQRGLGSLTGRVGYTWGPGMVYVKGGYAYSDNNEKVTLAGVPVPFIINGDHRNGYTVGAGVEYMFAPSWSAKVEYQYYNFGNANFVTPGALVPFGNFTTDDHVVKAGVNYRFNWGAPVAARY